MCQWKGRGAEKLNPVAVPPAESPRHTGLAATGSPLPACAAAAWEEMRWPQPGLTGELSLSWLN
jgi:hypothetical protein